MKFPTCRQIVELNRRHLRDAGEEFFEPDNLRNRGSLEWVLDAIQYPLFDIDHYPTLAEKAAILAWTVIRGHVFIDGNKRTGMSALEALLILNGYRLDATDEEIEEVALLVADRARGDYSYREFVQWLRSRIGLVSRSSIPHVG